MSATPQFPVVPQQHELDQLPRQLRFHPCANPRPQRLSHGQIEQFNRLGYLSGIRIFDAQEMVEHRRYFDELLASVLAAGGDAYAISSAHLQYGRVYDLLTHPRIVDTVSDLLGENVVGWGAHYFCKLPEDGKSVAWHQDASYWPLTPSKTVTLWLAIDQADRENGCMRLLPGSHLHGHLQYRPSDQAEANVLTQTVEQLERFGEPVDVQLEPGQISLHSDLLLHGSEPNRSTRRRCGLTLRYCTADVQAHLGWNRKGVVVRGSAPAHLWPGAPRPD